MCLSIAVHEPERVLGQGNHAGHEWIVVHNTMGYRCGYVKVEPGHPWHGLNYTELDDVDVHGGLTFAEADEACDKGGPDNGWWLGFDCAHFNDLPEVALMSPEHKALHGTLPSALCDYRVGVVRTQEYAEAECRSLCEQARQAGITPIEITGGEA